MADEIEYTQEEILDSVLLSVKQSVTGYLNETDFDPQLISKINLTFSVLHQMGVGPKKPFKITDATALWSDFTDDDERMEMVKEYVPQKVQLLFDPPTSSFLLEALKNSISELEWRLYVLAQTVEEDEDDD